LHKPGVSVLHLVRESRNLAAEYVSLAAEYVSLTAEYVSLAAEYVSLAAEYVRCARSPYRSGSKRSNRWRYIVHIGREVGRGRLAREVGRLTREVGRLAREVGRLARRVGLLTRRCWLDNVDERSLAWVTASWVNPGGRDRLWELF